jgi:hypothetical protein
MKNCVLLGGRPPSITPLRLAHGAVAQLIERVVRNDEVVGLIPICSTSLRASSYGSASQPVSRSPWNYSEMRFGEGCRAEAQRAQAGLGKVLRRTEG